MTTVVTRGAASAQALGYASSSAAVNYIEDVFSTYLYTGNGSTQTITNGIDLSTKGGMVWLKSRSAATNNFLFDTTRGALNEINSNTTDAQASLAASLTAFNTTGFALGAAAGINVSADTYTSWTFRKQPKFFDVVTYTGNSTARTIAHNLGSVPGCIIVKGYANMAPLGNVSDWQVYHRSIGNTFRSVLNATTEAIDIGNACWNSTTPTDTVFSLGTNSNVNQNTVTYVAYLFAHDAGGFGLTGTDNVISCGSYTTTAGGIGSATLGYEPQWLLLKQTNSANDWYVLDNMRGLSVGTNSRPLFPNLSDTEASIGIAPTSTGFVDNAAIAGSATIIYIAIRRGPMKVPTDATKVFSPIYSAAAANTVLTTSFPVDLQIPAYTGGTIGRFVVDRLRGVVTTAVDAATSPWMKTNATDAETTGFNITRAWDNTGYQIPQYLGGATTVYFNFRRAPGFFDEVCYTGTGAARTVTHNLAAVPELMIVKRRSSAIAWAIYPLDATKYMEFDTSGANNTSATWNNTAPTASVFTLGGSGQVNESGSTFVAYLFATCPGVSKVGSYTGTGTTLQINCGFTAGSRFVLIKRTDSTGDWYVWDSARGIVAGNDPYLLLNSTAAEVTSTDYVDTYSAGFEISSTAPAAINANGGSFIFLAIA